MITGPGVTHMYNIIPGGVRNFINIFTEQHRGKLTVTMNTSPMQYSYATMSLIYTFPIITRPPAFRGIT